jgi:hypothetical protein
MDDMPLRNGKTISNIIGILGIISLVVGIMLSVFGSGSMRERVGRLEGRMDTLAQVVTTRLDTLADAVARIEGRMERYIRDDTD